jgi:amidohydrolase
MSNLNLHPLYTEALSLLDYTRRLRRDFHMHPELGFEEIRSAGLIAAELRALGMQVMEKVAHTGVVGLLEGPPDGPVTMLRFDMDALPIQEAIGAEYASQTPGKMHACGHDSHMATGLTVARLLKAHQAELPGSVKFVFQPAEEGMGGAETMVKEGVLDNPKPIRVMAMHVWNEAPVGWVGVVPGPVMAGAETFSITVTGKGGHGALPNSAVDPVVASAYIVTALQSIVSRNIHPLQGAVVSVTQFHAGDVFNVIPQVVEMKGTIRTFERDVRKKVLERFDQIVQGVAGAMGCMAEITIHEITPAVNNDSALTHQVQQLVKTVLPEGITLDETFRTMGSEDMAFFMQEIPGCFIFIGSNNSAKGLVYSHHHPKFDIDEEALPYGVALLAAAVLELK